MQYASCKWPTQSALECGFCGMKQAKPGVLVVHLKVTPRSFSPVVYTHLYTSLEKGKLSLNVSYLSKVHEQCGNQSQGKKSLCSLCCLQHSSMYNRQLAIKIACDTRGRLFKRSLTKTGRGLRQRKNLYICLQVGYL